MPEAREYRLVRYYPQARVYEYDFKDFDSQPMLTAYDKEAAAPATFEDIEGRVIRFRTEHKPATSALEILRNYETALTKKGFTTIVSGRGSALPALDASGEETIGFWRLQEPTGGTVWVSLHAWYNGGRDNPVSDLTIVEAGAMEQSLETNSAVLAEVLVSTGRVAVYGITFETGRATIRPDSEAVLGEVLKLVAGDPGLRLTIEGHTDTVGPAAFNQKLSADRAAAVQAWLVAHGIAANRLAAGGFGDTRPVADNGSEEGRAKNRRVELVKH